MSGISTVLGGTVAALLLSYNALGSPGASGTPPAFQLEEDDGCPVPKVEVRNAWNGTAVIRAAAATHPDAGMNDLVLNLLIEANRGSVRFFEQAGVGRPDVDFILTADASAEQGSEARLSTTVTLVDLKGRTVRAPVRESYSRDEIGDVEVARRIAEPMNPLKFFIRSHQIRIRETEKSAIYATAEITPEAAEIERNEELTLGIRLVDCGPEPVPLPDREVAFEHHGVGSLDRETVTTDEDGRAEATFRSPDEGEARVLPLWRYENTSGIPNAAEANWSDISVAPSGNWTVTAEVTTAPRAMTITGIWDGRFRLVEGERVEGGGTLKTTVTGSCIKQGDSTGPLYIRGHREEDFLHVRLNGDLGEASREDIDFVESMECAVRTLVELPTFFAAIAELAERMRTAEEACPLRVPVSARSTAISCGGVDFTVTRVD